MISVQGKFYATDSDEILKLAKIYDYKLTFISQPNSYLETYKGLNGLHLYVVHNEKNLSLFQIRHILHLINKQTLDFCTKNNLTCVDMEEEFLKYDPNLSFVDNMHYTDIGCSYFADIINKVFVSKNHVDQQLPGNAKND